MSPTAAAILLIGLLASGLLGYLAYTHMVSQARKNTMSVGALERLASSIESGGAVLPQKASLENVASWVRLGPRTYSVGLARLVFGGCNVYAEPRGMGGLEVWGNWSSCGLLSVPALRGDAVVFYTANTTGEVGGVRVSGNRTLLVAWTDRIETAWWTASLGGPRRIIVVEKKLFGN